MQKHQRDAVDLVRELFRITGITEWEMRFTGRAHLMIKFKTPTGGHGSVTWGCSPSDQRSRRNFEAQIRRLVTPAG